jgi:hypothetical protein
MYRHKEGKKLLEAWLKGYDAQYEHRSGKRVKTILAEVYKAIDHHGKDEPVRMDSCSLVLHTCV